MIGQSIGSYHITAKLGAGGMGEVWKARDTKLGRDVALKLLPAAFASDPDRMARFEREARVLASLDHPNIAAIYGLEDSNGVRALVLALIEGPTLAERIAAGPIPLDEAIQIARQIAEAVEYAHERGVIHRDLKPANIKVTSGGMVKVLDFGLAKALDDNPAAGSGSNSPTLTIGATRAGVLLGTAAYMSPEQAKGKQADRRSDIWAFGVVLSEMLTGKPLFTGETAGEVLASVIKEEPKLDMVPLELRGLVSRCLNKDARKRLQAIGEARIVLEDPAPPTPVQLGPAQPARYLPWMTAVGLLAVALPIVSWIAWRATRPMERALQPLMRLSVDLGPDAVAGEFTTTAISPDGSRLVFPIKSPDGKQMLATRLLSETSPRLLSGTDNGRDPFFSPDGQWIGFFADGKMKKISIQGGAPGVLCDALDARGASWREDGNIVVALNTFDALSRVLAEGGTPQPVTKLQGNALTHRWPQPLSGREAVLFTLSSSTLSFEDASIAAVSLKTGQIKVLVRGGYFGRYLPTGGSTGHLVYVHEGVLFAVPFDPARLELRGAAVPMLDDLAADPNSGAGQFSFSGAPSGAGTFAYRSGKVSAQGWPVSWLDNSGKILPLIATPGFYMTPRFSPAGQQLALAQTAGDNRGVFVYDWQRDTMSRLTFDIQLPLYPTWSPDGKHIAFSFLRDRGYSIGWIRADGAGEIQRLLESRNRVVPYSFFPDGRRLAYYELDPDSGYDLWTLALDLSDPDHPKVGKPELFLRTSSNELLPAFSPDGRWIAYQSNESGRAEVYVRPFPGPGGKWQISNAGGSLPIWSRNGRELFFENLDNRIMVTDYTATGESFVARKPRPWSDRQLQAIGGPLNYDLAPDGKRFAIFPNVTAPAEEKGDVHMTFLLNFFDELRRRAPVSK